MLQLDHSNIINHQGHAQNRIVASSDTSWAARKSMGAYFECDHNPLESLISRSQKIGYDSAMIRKRLIASTSDH